MSNKRPVIICTAHKGVFFGYTDIPDLEILAGGSVELTDAKMAIYWGTNKGVMQLAATGPTTQSRIGAKTDIALNAITAVFTVSPDAAEKWATA